jgi:hypothetical protein
MDIYDANKRPDVLTFLKNLFETVALLNVNFTWNENHGKNSKCCHWLCTQAEIGRKRGELATREWCRLHGVQRRAT